MVRLSEENLNTSKFVGLTEECQLAINGGCTSKKEFTIVDDIVHALWRSAEYSRLGYHNESACPYCQ